MRRVVAGLASLAAAVAVPGVAAAAPSGTGTSVQAAVSAQPAGGAPSEKTSRSDSLPNPRAAKQSALKQKAHELVLSGKRTARGDGDVVRVAKGQYVELTREDEDSIWTVLGEFGPGQATHDGLTHTGPAGPAHNEIAEPDRSVDNTTIWTEDFSEPYYEELLFSEEEGAISMRNFYIEQSSNRYTVNGDVTDWVQVPNNATSYGSNDCDHDAQPDDPDDSIVCADTWFFVNDSVDGWYEEAVASGMSDQEIADYLAKFDVWDRYDVDGDGNFDEPDGYIDHFQSVHAGVGEETGGGAQGSDAIWSHRWYAYFSGDGPDGAGPNGFGGVEIGDSGVWIGDYTIEPENGGVGVFAHEFGHDLGLPDLYDTSGNTGGAENSTAFWTLMSSGSYGSSGDPADGIGSKPMHMGNWEKFQLGWLDYEVVNHQQRRKIVLGPSEFNTKKAQGAFLLLPDRPVDVDLGAPFEGEQFYYSESGDNLNNSMTKQVDVTTGNLTAKVRYDIEEDWDYAYLTVNGEEVETNLSRDTNPNGTNLGEGITGDTDGEWVDLTADLSSFAGQTVDVGFKYVTDGAVSEPGFQADNISLDGQLIGTAESDEGWTFDGFRTTTGDEVKFVFNAYVLENRQYLGFDKSLKTGPYNFGFLDTRPDWVEHFSYQKGLLINYWNTEFDDNSVGDHPGGGQVLPVDAHPRLEHWSDGTLMRMRLQSYDSTFGLQPTQSYTLHNNGVPTTIESKPAVRVFDDSRTYWHNCDAHACTGEHVGHYQPGWSSVDVPNTGTRVRVLSTSKRGTFMKVVVNGR